MSVALSCLAVWSFFQAFGHYLRTSVHTHDDDVRFVFMYKLQYMMETTLHAFCDARRHACICSEMHLWIWKKESKQNKHQSYIKTGSFCMSHSFVVAPYIRSCNPATRCLGGAMAMLAANITNTMDMTDSQHSTLNMNTVHSWFAALACNLFYAACTLLRSTLPLIKTQM